MIMIIDFEKISTNRKRRVERETKTDGKMNSILKKNEFEKKKKNEN